MTLTAMETNVIAGERGDSDTTLTITDSTTITWGNFLELSSGKLIKSITTLSSSLVGVAATSKIAGVYSTQGFQDYIGVTVEGLIKLKGLVEGSGGTYTSALAVGDKISFHYDATTGYGQFVVNSDAAPIGIVVEGSVASSGSTGDQWDYVLVQLDFERNLGGAAGVADGSISTAKIADSAVTSTKTGIDVPGSINATKQHADMGTYACTATETTAVIDWSATLSSTAGVKVFAQALTVTGTIPIPGTMTDTSFTLTATNLATGNWFAWIPESSK